VAAGETSRAAAPASIAPATRAAGLPRTGTDAGSLAALAAAILLAGSAFRRFAGRLSVR
jgi:LPXTG-motif cell wall-anchored protein